MLYSLIWDLWGRFCIIVGAIWALFWWVLAPRAVSGPPLGRSRVTLGPRLPPTKVQGAKSWFVGPPPGFPNEVILAWIFIDFSNKKGIGFRLDYGNDFKWKMMPKCFQKPLTIHWKIDSFFDWFLSGIWCRFASVQGLLNLDFCNTFYAKTCFLEFDLTLIW